MLTCAELFKADLDSKNLPCDVKDLDDRTIISITYQKLRTVLMFNGAEGENVQILTVIDSVPADKYADTALACNQLNSTFRFLKFFVDKDNDVLAVTDAILDPSSAEKECFELLIRNLKVISDAKPIILRAIYC